MSPNKLGFLNHLVYSSVIIFMGHVDDAVRLLDYLLLRRDAAIISEIHPSTYYTVRLCVAGVVAGMAAGAYQKGTIVGLQFMAENAHRMPRTKGGWFQFHQAKNHRIIKHAGIAAVKTGAKFGLLTSVYAVSEQIIESRLGENWKSPTFAGMTTGVFFCVYAKLSSSLAKRAVIIGTLAGLSIGILQDGYRIINGKSIKSPGNF